MKRLIIFLITLALAAPSFAQNKKTTKKRTTKTTRVTKKKTTKKKTKTADYSTKEIRGLRSERTGIQRKIKEQERLLNKNKADVKKRLGSLMILNTEIDQRQKSIEGIEKDITHIDGNIGMLKSQLATLEQQLQERKAKYVKSMQYMARNRSIQDKLMFIFSAKNLAQMYRRMRFVREYAAYQRAQGEMVKAKQKQIHDKNQELERVKGQKNTLLSKGKREQATLQGQQEEQKKMVSSLQKQQKTIQSVIADQRKKDAELNAQIDRLVAEEMAKAKARAEAEARRKAAEAAAAAKKRAEELARKKAEAEAAARENARRVQEAREREARLKAEARAAERKSAEERRKAEQAAKEAEANRVAAERKAKVDEKRHENEVEKAKKSVSEATNFDTADRKLSSNFERNRGRLSMPVNGSYKIVTRFGMYNVEGLRNVKLQNRGINIQVSPGTTACAVFEGEVSAVSNFGGSKVVMVRHGNYISVYSNLRNVSVHKGQKVSTRQTLGTVDEDNIMQFQLRHRDETLNPETWLRK